ncbi:MAG: hypothetical protein RBS55_08195 [Bacteroidales bacterium]|jgi:hypothetical protein|nr:hypothetical protein [Bacteroidales bacterium]
MEKRFIALLLGLFIIFPASCQILHLFGGSDHNVYLGCLNCNKYDANSIWNTYGTYGSKYNINSIWNAYGTYGSKYNLYCPWNQYSSDPPVVVDKEGNFYGYFTVNKFKYNRADFELALTIYEYYDLIRDDVSKWYDKLFN